MFHDFSIKLFYASLECGDAHLELTLSKVLFLSFQNKLHGFLVAYYKLYYFSVCGADWTILAYDAALLTFYEYSCSF